MKMQTQSSADRITTSLILAHQEKNKQTKIRTNLTLYKAQTSHWTKLRKVEIKRKKEFNIEAWEKEASNTVSLKKKEKTEKYYTNEGTNGKHRSPNKGRGYWQTT